MKNFLLGFSLVASVCFSNTQDYEWTQLFNGKNLDGWDFKIRRYNLNTDPKNTFRVDTIDGTPVLRADYSDYTNYKESGQELFGHIGTKKEYSYYTFAVEYRFRGNQVAGGPGWADRNNGIMFHSQSMASMGLNQDFPNSIEAQLLVRGSGNSLNAQNNICTPGTHYYNGNTKVTGHCTNGSQVSIGSELEWIRSEVVVLGDSAIHHVVKGDTVISYHRPILNNGTPLKKGHIALQGESHPTEFRKIEIVELIGCMDDSYVDYKPYFVKEDASKCQTVKSAGCTNPDYDEYDESHNVSDSSQCQTLSSTPFVAAPIWNVNVLNKSVQIEYSGNGVVRLIDVQGQVVATKSFEKSLLWNVESLVASGVYQVQLETQGVTYFKSAVFFQ